MGVPIVTPPAVPMVKACANLCAASGPSISSPRRNMSYNIFNPSVATSVKPCVPAASKALPRKFFIPGIRLKTRVIHKASGPASAAALNIPCSTALASSNPSFFASSKKAGNIVANIEAPAPIVPATAPVGANKLPSTPTGSNGADPAILSTPEDLRSNISPGRFTTVLFGS